MTEIAEASPRLHEEELRYWLALQQMPGVGPATFHKIRRTFPKVSEALTLPKRLAQQHPLLAPFSQHCPDWESVERALSWAQQPENYILTLDHEDYPPALREITPPPPILFVRGKLAALTSPQIAMVGSRNPTPIGYENAYYFAAALAEAGLTITSGLAAGIDAASHKGALKAKGKSIAVMGRGLDRVYPAKHANWAELLLEEGAWLSEYAPGATAKAHHFPARNRLISALSRGILVVEAAMHSGSLITARYGVEQNKAIMAIPGSVHSPLARGCHHLLRSGAKLVETVEDVLEEVQWERHILKPSQPIRPRAAQIKLDEGMQTLLECVDFAPTSVDVVCQRSGMSVQEAVSGLTQLELQGHIINQSGGYIRASEQIG